MGVFDNVVLTYQHPYIATYLQDNTIYTEEAEAEIPTPSFNGIQVGFFGGGRDNVVLYSTNTEMFVNEYTKPNYKLYGQAAYNAVAALDTGSCGMYTLRLMPDDATFANAVIMVDWKESEKEVQVGTEDEPKTETRKVLSVKFRKTKISNATRVAQIKTGVAKLYKSEADAEGYNSAPLIALWQLGRGTYGNATKIKFVDSVDYESEETTFRSYEIDVMETARTGLTVKEQLIGSIVDGVLDYDNTKNLSQFLEDVIDDPGTGSNKINVAVMSDTMEKIYEQYQKTFAEHHAGDADAVLPTIEKFDIIFGNTLMGEVDPVIDLVDNSTAADYANLIAVDGFALAGGSNGALDAADPTAVEKTKTDLLLKAFRGDIDKRLSSRFSTPANFCLDANFPEEVKREMAAWAAKREYDAMTYLDTGLLTSNTEIISLLRDLRSLTSFNLVKEPGCYKWRDLDYTGKLIPVTATHAIARKLPRHIAINAYTTPFAREDAQLVSGTDFVAGSFAPIINPDDNDVKKNYYKYGANCYETIKSGVVQRSTGITTCTANSDRKLEFNEYILQAAVKLAYDILNSKLYKIGEAEQRAQYQKHAEKQISYELAPYLRSVSVEFVMTERDERRSVMRLKMRLVFKTVVTRGILEIYLDPRTGTVVDATTTSSTATPV